MVSLKRVPGDAKMLLDCMHFRSTKTEKNYHISPYIPPIKFFFRVFSSWWNVIFWLSFQNTWTWVHELTACKCRWKFTKNAVLQYKKLHHRLFCIQALRWTLKSLYKHRVLSANIDFAWPILKRFSHNKLGSITVWQYAALLRLTDSRWSHSMCYIKYP